MQKNGTVFRNRTFIMKIQDHITTTDFVLAITLSFISCPILYGLDILSKEASIGFLLSLILITLIILLIFLGTKSNEILRNRSYRRDKIIEENLGSLAEKTWQEDIASILLLNEGFEVKQIRDFLQLMEDEDLDLTDTDVDNFLKVLCENGYARCEIRAIDAYTESGELSQFKSVIRSYFATNKLIMGRKNYRNIVVGPY